MQNQVVIAKRLCSLVVKGPKAEIEEVKKAKGSSGGYRFADSRACWLRKGSDREVLTRSGKAVHQLGFAPLNRAWRRGEKLRSGSVDNLGIAHRKALDLFMYLRALACGKHDRTLGRSSPFYRADGKAGSPQSLASAG